MIESYDQIKVTVLEVIKMISDYLHESKDVKLDKRIDEDLTIIHKKTEKLEEESKEEKDLLKSPDVFDKKYKHHRCWQCFS